MSPIKWRMLYALLTDAVDASPPGTDFRETLTRAREVAKWKLRLEEIPRQSYLHHKMQSG